LCNQTQLMSKDPAILPSPSYPLVRAYRIIIIVILVVLLGLSITLLYQYDFAFFLSSLILTPFFVTIYFVIERFVIQPIAQNIDKQFKLMQDELYQYAKANDELAQKNLISHQQTEKIADQHIQLKQQHEEITIANENLQQTQIQLEQAIAEREVFNQELLVTLNELEMAKIELNKFAEVIKNTNNAVLVCDKNCKVEYVNKGFETITGYALAEVKGLKPKHLLGTTPVNEKAIFEIQQAVKQARSFSGEVFNYRKNGEPYWFKLNICPVFNDEKELINFIAIETEITEQKNKEALLEEQKATLQAALQDLKQAQMQLVQSEKLSSLGQLTAGIAHEINNPINFVFAGVQALGDVITDLRQLFVMYGGIQLDLPLEQIHEKLVEIEAFKKEIAFHELDEDVQSLLSDISLGAERTQNIVKSLRTFTRLDEHESKPADLHENLDSTLTILRSELKDRIDLQRDYDQNLPLVTCSIGQINQVFLNIINNAAQAINGSGTIKIQTQVNTTTQMVEVNISDSGTGMDQDTIDRIYDPFFTTKAVGEGTGLGLAISSSIIEKHHGHIHVESEIGKGTTFTISLPL